MDSYHLVYIALDIQFCHTASREDRLLQNDLLGATSRRCVYLAFPLSCHTLDRPPCDSCIFQIRVIHNIRSDNRYDVLGQRDLMTGTFVFVERRIPSPLLSCVAGVLILISFSNSGLPLLFPQKHRLHI